MGANDVSRTYNVCSYNYDHQGFCVSAHHLPCEQLLVGGLMGANDVSRTYNYDHQGSCVSAHHLPCEQLLAGGLMGANDASRTYNGRTFV
jgi:hypothetical protein